MVASDSTDGFVRDNPRAWPIPRDRAAGRKINRRGRGRGRTTARTRANCPEPDPCSTPSTTLTRAADLRNCCVNRSEFTASATTWVARRIHSPWGHGVHRLRGPCPPGFHK